MGENLRNASVSVGAASVIVAPELMPNDRRVLVITNTSTGGQNITLAWGETAVAGAGIFLTPNSTWSESIDSGFMPSHRGVFAIASAAGGTVAVHERVLS